MPELPTISLLLGTTATAAMAGIAWLIHLLVYPQFRRVAASDWRAYHQAHLRALGQVAAPLMVMEAVTVCHWLLMATATDRLGLRFALVAAGLTAMTWVLTFGGAVPLHRRLRQNFAAAVYENLMRVNLARALLWSAKTAWVIAHLPKAIA